METREAPFKLEISKNQKSISFTERSFGEVGKDIIAVKEALGIILPQSNGEGWESPSTEAPPEPGIPMDNNGWFDCTTGKRISIEQAATFDSKMENALINYQVNNQFIILCYLFEMYGVKNLLDSVGQDYHSTVVVDEQVEYERGILQQLDSIQVLFEQRELGHLGEATLAVMHGWLPHSNVSNNGYVHSDYILTYSVSQRAVDVLPEVLLKDFEAGRLGQGMESLISRGHIEGTIKYNNEVALQDYLRLVSEEQKWISDSSAIYPYGSLEYNIIKEGENNSLLYSSAVSVLEKLNEYDLQLQQRVGTGMESTDKLRRAFYPDPFSSTEPFYINEEKQGFYLETDFVLAPTGPLPKEDSETIKELEDKALEQVLRHFNKPNVWYIPVRDDFLTATFFSPDTPPAITHDGLWPHIGAPGIKKYVNRFIGIQNSINIKKDKISEKERMRNESNDSVERARLTDRILELRGEIEDLDQQYAAGIVSEEEKALEFWVVGTTEGINKANTDWPGRTIAQHWSELDSFGAQYPLIKFVEYKTPSLRPGQKYRALFEIGSRKLDAIRMGIDPIPQAQPAPPPGSPEPSEEQCTDGTTSESMRTLEEYRVHARKKRREIVRKLREHLQDEEKMRSSPTVDLGTQGPFNLDSGLRSLLGFDINGASDYEYTKGVMTRLGDVGTSALQSLGVLDTDVDHFNNIANKSNSQIEASDTKGKKRQDTLEITLEELKERIDTIIKDLQESSEIVSSEGIQFNKGSKFDAKKESTLLKRFYSEFVDLVMQNVSDYWGPKVADYMRTNPDKTELFIKFEATNSGNPNNPHMGPYFGKKIVAYSAQLPTKKKVPKIGGEPWYHSGVPVGEDKSQVLTSAFDFLASGGQVNGDLNQATVNTSKVLSRPRTVNYISRIKEMTGLLTDRPNEIISIFDDGRGACRDLGINLEKRQASSYIAKYTSGVQVNHPPGDPTGPSWSKIAKSTFVDPAATWASQSASNWQASFADTFNESEALRLLGEMCTLEDLYREFFDKLDVASLLCDWLKCIRLPNFNIKLPSFYLPPLPTMPILGWYGAIWNFLIDNIKQILTRIVCTLVKTIIDKLAYPFCEEQLRDFINAGSSSTPIMDQALAAALTETGISGEKSEEAKKFFEDVASITTGQELCHLLSGQRLDDSSMLMIRRMLKKNNLEEELSTEDALLNYFDLLGTILPEDLCEELGKSITIPVSKDCIDVSNYISDIRSRLQSGDSSLSDEEIDRVVQMAQEEMNKKRDDLSALSGNSVGKLLPEAYRPGDSTAIISDYPDFLKQELSNTIQNSFSDAKISYMESLSSYIPTMSITTPDLPKAGEENYSDQLSLNFEASLTQMALYAASIDANNYNFPSFAQQIFNVDSQSFRDMVSQDLYELIDKGKEIAERAQELLELIEKHESALAAYGNADSNFYWINGNNDWWTIRESRDIDRDELEMIPFKHEGSLGLIAPGQRNEIPQEWLDENGFEIEYFNVMLVGQPAILYREDPEYYSYMNPEEAGLQPFMGFKKYYNKNKQIWNSNSAIPAALVRSQARNYSGIARTGQSREQLDKFLDIRLWNVDDTLTKLNILIDEYKSKIGSPNAGEDPYDINTQSDIVPDIAPFGDSSPAEINWYRNWYQKQLVSEEAGLPVDHIFRTKNTLLSLVALCIPEGDFVSAILDKMNKPIDIYWYNALMLYAQFEKEEIPLSSRPGTHLAFKKSRVRPGAQPFTAKIKRTPRGFLDYLITSPLNVQFLPGMIQTTIRGVGGLYHGIFNMEPGDAEYVTNEVFYESVTSPEQTDEFVLTVQSLEPALFRETDQMGDDGEVDFDPLKVNQLYIFPADVPDLIRTIEQGRDWWVQNNTILLEQGLPLLEQGEFMTRIWCKTNPDNPSQFSVIDNDASIPNQVDGLTFRDRVEAAAGLTNGRAEARLATIIKTAVQLDSPIYVNEGNAAFDLLEERVKTNQTIVDSITYGNLAPTTRVDFTLPLIAADLTGQHGSPSRALDRTLEVIAFFAERMFGRKDEDENNIVELITDVNNLQHAEKYIKLMNGRPNDPVLLDVIRNRINELTNNVSDALANRPSIISAKHLLMLDRVIQLTNNIVSLKGQRRDWQELSLEFGLYNPSINHIQLPSKVNLDRYDVVISSDYHLQQSSELQSRVFRFCEKIPSRITRMNNPTQYSIYPSPREELNVRPGYSISYPAQTQNSYFSKREAFSRMLINSIKSAHPGFSVPNYYHHDFAKSTYPKIDSRVMEILTQQLSKSRLFDVDYAREIDIRISAEPVYDEENKCHRNRYGLVESSILSFNKVILEETYMEIMKESAKPENSPFLRDFDDPSPIELAMQSISLKAFVRVCLIDTLLKGGLAYSIWDIEPVVSTPIFLEYTLEHVKLELEKSRFFKPIWKKMVQKTIGISNAPVALRRLVEQEIVKLPDYSKQVFNFDHPEEDYYNWFFNHGIVKVSCPKTIGPIPVDFSDFDPDIEEEHELPTYQSTEEAFTAHLPFYVEEFVRVEGKILSREILQTQRVVDHLEAHHWLKGVDNPENQSVVLSVESFNLFLRAVASTLPGGTRGVAYKDVIESSTIKHGMRLIVRLTNFGNPPDTVREDFEKDMLNGFSSLSEAIQVSRREKSHLTTISLEAAFTPESPNDNALMVSKFCYNAPIVNMEREIEFDTCTNVFVNPDHPSAPGLTDHFSDFLKQEFLEYEQFRDMFEHIFPTRRYMALNSILATSSISGYAGMPNLFSAVKSAIGFMGVVSTTPASRQSNLVPVSQDEFKKIITENWPSHPEQAESCFEFPGFSKEFFVKFFEDLWKLILQLPSILFRGVANQIDPAYKEMRQHYMNCDIRSLDWTGLTIQTVDSPMPGDGKLTNGLMKIDDDNETGFYAPLVPTGLADAIAGTGILLGKWDPKPLGVTISRIVTYAYSGFAPFVDLNTAFSIPCAGINKEWQKGGKYDMGAFGRYGHPMTPFTILALSTPELDSDKKLKEPNCRDENPQIDTEECEE